MTPLQRRHLAWATASLVFGLFLIVNAGPKAHIFWRTKIAHFLSSIPNRLLRRRPRRSHRLGRPFHI
jgi:hypothetical protein